MGRLQHDRPGYTYACPACDGAGQVYEREGQPNASIDPDRPYLCEKCSTGLQYVIARPKKRIGGPERQSTLPGLTERRDTVRAREVEVMSPEDFGLAPIGARPGD